MEQFVNIKSQKDFFSGLMFLIIGGAFAIGAYSYGMGDGARMGPGYFPRLLGVLLALLGSFIIFESLTISTPDGEKIGKWVWRPVVFIVSANLAFGVLLGGLPSIKLPAMGMIAAIFALTIIAAKAGENFKLKENIILAAILAAGSYVIFIMLLKLQIPVWPTFISG
jgi:Tripartite tricarboxylate transporter TctB family